MLRILTTEKNFKSINIIHCIVGKIVILVNLDFAKAKRGNDLTVFQYGIGEFSSGPKKGQTYDENKRRTRCVSIFDSYLNLTLQVYIINSTTILKYYFASIYRA